MSSGPIFQSSSDLALWRKLARVGTDRLFIGRRVVSPESIAKEVLESEGPAHSAILVRLMDTLYDSGNANLNTLIPELVSKRRRYDSTPALEAALLLHKIGDTKKAKDIFGSISEIQNIPLKHIVRARMLLDDGDMSSAKVVLMKGRCSDPLNTRIYKMLEEADPAGGWMYYRNIELLHAGRNTVACGTADDETPQEKLYKIYCEWHKEFRDTATKMLVNSPEYEQGDFHYILAAARMSAYEEDWNSSEMIYSRLVEDGCVYILCEAAKASLMNGNEDRAFRLYKRAELEDPHSPLVLSELIDAYLKIGSKTEAVNKILTLLDSEFADLDMHLRCSKILVSEEMYVQAGPIIHRILMNYPENFEVNMLMSENEMALGNFSAALKAANTAVKVKGKEREPRLQRAKVMFAMGKPERAMKDARFLLNTDPEDIEALTLIKDIYVILGRERRYMEMYDRILEIDPNNAQIILEQSEAKMRRGDTVDSLESFKRAIAADPKPANFISVVRLLVSDGMYREAVEICEEMNEEYGAITVVRILRGNAEYALGEYLNASVSFAAAAALNPHLSEVWHSKGMADEAAGDLDSAEDAFNRAVLLELDKPEHWISKASIQEHKNDLRGAVESLNRVIELKPDNVYALVKKGMIFAEYKKYDEAIYFLDMAIMVAAWNKDIHNIKKEIYIHTGRYEEAITVCMEILSIDSTDIPAIVDAAECMMKIGKQTDALSLINSKLSKYPLSIPLLLSKKSILTYMKDYPELIKVSYLILENDPDNRSVKMDLVQALTDNGDMASAERMRMELYDEDATLEPIEDIIEDDSEDDLEEADPESQFKIARSLYSTGDLVGAARLTDRALETDPGNLEFITFRVEIYLALKDTNGAIAVIGNGLENTDAPGELFELEGDVWTKMEEYSHAAESYSSAIESGNDGHDVYVKRGDILEKTGNLEGAVSDYLTAVSISGSDNTSRIRLASIYVSEEYYEEAEKIIQVILDDDAYNSEALVLKAKIYSALYNTDGLLKIYELMTESDIFDEDALRKFSTLLSKHGLQHESSVLSIKASKLSGVTETKVSDEIKRMSEKLLRRAYVSKRSLDDPGIIDILDKDEEIIDAIISYLSDIRDYGLIVPGTPEFERMESLSHYAVVRADLKDIEKEPLISLPTAYVAGGAKDADEAKVLVAYIFEAFSAEVRIDYIPEELTEIAFSIDKNITVFDLIKEHNLGVYTARAVKELSSLTSETS